MFFKVAHGAPTNIRFANGFDFQGTHDPGFGAEIFQGILQGHGIDHRGQHPHVVTLGAVHAAFFQLDSSENVATTDHNGDFNAQIAHLLDLAGIREQRLGIDTETLVTHQGFSAQFEQYPLVFHGDGIRNQGI